MSVSLVKVSRDLLAETARRDSRRYAAQASRCAWCAGSEQEHPANLCRAHVAEYAGLTERELDRSDDEQAAEWLEVSS
jgi:hypothetical protein